MSVKARISILHYKCHSKILFYLSPPLLPTARKVYDEAPEDFKTEVRYPTEHTWIPLSKPLTWGDMVYVFVDKPRYSGAKNLPVTVGA